MDLRQIEAFICLCDEGSVTRAAAQLGVVQSAVSMQISKLESSLGVKLFERKARGMVPTPLGKQYYDRIVPLVQEFDAVRRELLDTSGRVAGIISLGIVPSLNHSILPDVIKHYSAKFPDVYVQITESNSRDLLDLLDRGLLDVAIVSDTGQPSHLVRDRIITEDLVVISGDHSRLKLDAVPLRMLPDLSLILPTKRQNIRMGIDRHLARLGLAVKPKIELDGLMPTLALIRKGEWSTVIACGGLLHYLREAGYRISPIVEPSVRRDISVFHHPRRPITIAAQEFCRMVSERLKEMTEAPADQP